METIAWKKSGTMAKHLQENILRKNIIGMINCYTHVLDFWDISQIP